MDSTEPDRFFTLKDLARLMQVSPRTIKRWSRRLKVPPTIPHNHCQRWDATAARLFFVRMTKANPDPSPTPYYARPD